MSASTKVPGATARQVREWANAPEQTEGKAALSEQAQHTLRDGARGRLHPEVFAWFNANHRKSEAYNLGNQAVKSIEYKRTQPSGRTVKDVSFLTDAEQRDMLTAAGVEVPARGPLSKALVQAVSDLLSAKSAESVTA